tara:strand:- start:8635 stop:9234 length:600 start_codon:yes stop_codon:yes gene_type:complete
MPRTKQTARRSTGGGRAPVMSSDRSISQDMQESSDKNIFRCSNVIVYMKTIRFTSPDKIFLKDEVLDSEISAEEVLKRLTACFKQRLIPSKHDDATKHAIYHEHFKNFMYRLLQIILHGTQATVSYTDRLFEFKILNMNKDACKIFINSKIYPLVVAVVNLSDIAQGRYAISLHKMITSLSVRMHEFDLDPPEMDFITP